MSSKQTDSIAQLIKQLSIQYIKTEELPNIDLYMDQVTTFINGHLSDAKLKPDDKTLTKTMINNYAKNNLLPPPVKKKYSKEHMIVLIFIYYLKYILPIGSIQEMLNPLTSRFFNPADNEGHVDMTSIYNEVLSSIKEQVPNVNTDIINMLKFAGEHFTEVENDDDREFLQALNMICMLMYDVFLKKQLIESLISSLSPEKEAPVKKDAAATKDPQEKDKEKDKEPKKKEPDAS